MSDLAADMNAIEGVVSELASRDDYPQGYPFKRVTVWATRGAVSHFDCYDIVADELRFLPASQAKDMKVLDFRKAGKDRPDMVKHWKDNFDEIPAEYLITHTQFPQTDEPTRKTTSCRRYLVEVERDDMPERWAVIQFRKAIKKYITEDLELNIMPCVFGDKYPAENPPVVSKVLVDLLDCSEFLYQALEEYGYEEFSHYPIRLKIPTRKELWHIDYTDAVDVGGAKVRICW